MAARRGVGRGRAHAGVARARERLFAARCNGARAVPSGSGFTLSGLKRHVTFASSADRLVVLARTGDGEEDVDLFLVDPTASGVSLRQQFTIASDTQYEITFSDVVLVEADRIGGAGTGWATWQGVLEPALVLLAAQAVGGARYALEITTQYALDRHQFDKAARRLPGVGALPLRRRHQRGRRRAAGARGRLGRRQRAPPDRLAPMAKLFACSTFRDITAMAQQIFGGIGFTLDFDIQLYFRRAKQQQLMWANDRTLEDDVAAALLD